MELFLEILFNLATCVGVIGGVAGVSFGGVFGVSAIMQHKEYRVTYDKPLQDLAQKFEQVQKNIGQYLSDPMLEIQYPALHDAQNPYLQQVMYKHRHIETLFEDARLPERRGDMTVLSELEEEILNLSRSWKLAQHHALEAAQQQQQLEKLEGIPVIGKFLKRYQKKRFLQDNEQRAKLELETVPRQEN